MKIKDFFKRNKTIFSIVLFLIGISLFLTLMIRTDPDYFWHIKAGEYMFKHGILHHDIFSWIVNGKYWISHEWLFEIIIYVFQLLFGQFHMAIYGFICIFTLFLILFLGNKENYLKNIPFTLWWIILSLILVVHIQVRPHLISFCFLALTIYFLYDLYHHEESRKIYLLPVITIFWANIHGGSSNLSYLFCFLFIVTGMFSFKCQKIEAIPINKRQIKKYLLVMILCMISVNINVHGFKLFIYPYSNMFDSVMINNISEWQPTVLGNPTHYLYFGLLLIIFFIFLFSKKKILFIDFVLFGMCVFLGLKSIRFWGYTYIIMSFVIFNYIEKRKYDKGIHLCIGLISVLFICFFLVNIHMVFANTSKRSLDTEVISIIKSSNVERLYNFYDYGGELIYHDILVFVDGRADLYSKYNYKDYLDISLLQGDYVQLIDKYNFDYFLVNKKYPISTYLKYNDDYEKLYSNGEVILYKKIG